MEFSWVVSNVLSNNFRIFLYKREISVGVIVFVMSNGCLNFSFQNQEHFYWLKMLEIRGVGK